MALKKNINKTRNQTKTKTQEQNKITPITVFAKLSSYSKTNNNQNKHNPSTSKQTSSTSSRNSSNKFFSFSHTCSRRRLKSWVASRLQLVSVSMSMRRHMRCLPTGSCLVYSSLWTLTPATVVRSSNQRTFYTCSHPFTLPTHSGEWTNWRATV